MAVERIDTGWQGTEPGKTVRRIRYITQDVAAAEGDITDVESGLGADRIVLSFANADLANAVTIKFWTSEDWDEPSSTHRAGEWDQEPDGATTYAVPVSTGANAEGRQKRTIAGPVKWFKVRGFDGAATTGKLEIHIHMYKDN